MRTTQRKGDIATSQAIATFTRLGYDVSIPMTESASYDLVVDDGSALHRVQVKYTSTGGIDLRKIHSNSSGYVVKLSAANDYDWLYAFTSTGDEYLIKQCLINRKYIKLTSAHSLEPGCS